MLRRLIRSLAVTTLAAFATAAAHAGIREYNEAVQANDYKRASAEAVQIWATYDKTRSDTAVIAREFAWIAINAGEDDTARVYAEYLVTNGATLATPDNDPLLSKLLLAWSKLGKTPNREARAALSDAIRAWADSNSTTASPIAATAATVVYSRGWNAQDWKATERDARMAEALYSRLGVEGFLSGYRASVDASAASFMSAQKAGAWLQLADATDAMLARLAPPRPGRGLDLGDMEPAYFRALAWMDSMEAFLDYGKRNASMLDSPNTLKREWEQVEARRASLKSRCNNDCTTPLPPGEIFECRGQWVQTPAILYPSGALFKGFMGATIVRLTTNEAGKVIDAQQMAAVPTEIFPEVTLKAVRQWSLKRKDEDSQSCSLAGTRDLHVVFQIK